MDGAYYKELLRPLFAGRRCVLFGMHLRPSMARAHLLRELGAEAIFVVAPTEGTGPEPDSDSADWLLLGLEAPDPVAEFRLLERLLERPPPQVEAALTRFDPERRATVYLPPVMLASREPSLLGRRLYGVRPAAWLALEDKVAVDGFWDSLGVAHAPMTVVAPADAPAAARSLDRGQGTVWAGDARDGVHGGSALVRWLRSGAPAERDVDFFGRRCRHVRVMPFLEGIPCSIHGWVFPDWVAVFRPVEMMTLRPATGSRFRYAGCASYYDPPDAIRVQMRRLARTVGSALRDRVGFRGVFTVDGVATDSGFLPTELNPRYGAGMSLFSVPDLPVAVLAQASAEGEDLDYRPRYLQRLMLEQADGKRAGGAWTTVDAIRVGSQVELSLAWKEGGYDLAAEGETADASLVLGPGAAGGFVRFTPDPDRTPAGPSLAPRAISALAFADRELGTGLGKLLPARDVHSAT